MGVVSGPIGERRDEGSGDLVDRGVRDSSARLSQEAVEDGVYRGAVARVHAEPLEGRDAAAVEKGIDSTVRLLRAWSKPVTIHLLPTRSNHQTKQGRGSTGSTALTSSGGKI